MPYELWSIALPTMPARSRLYSLAPMGVGSAQVESVTSYVMRLANAHAVFLALWSGQKYLRIWLCAPNV